MMSLQRTFRISVVALLAVVASLQAAESMTQVKDRMAKRLAVINELKSRQLVGENNKGYLTVLKEGECKKREREAVKNENEDRALVYEYIAGKTGSTATLVGERRAVQIAKQSAPGIMIQDRHGKWYEKKT